MIIILDYSQGIKFIQILSNLNVRYKTTTISGSTMFDLEIKPTLENIINTIIRSI